MRPALSSMPTEQVRLSMYDEQPLGAPPQLDDSSENQTQVDAAAGLATAA